MADAKEQTVEHIPVKDLILWTENPRDPISPRSKNEAIICRALEDVDHKWSLRKLAKTMGAHYDFSELPTVVYKSGYPIVYDGNRRVVLAMLKLGLYPRFANVKFRMPECPEILPCCVAPEDIALENVWRKHADTGSWDQISRDIFLHKFRKQEKSVLLQLDELLDRGIASTSYLNQRFVRDEVLTNPRLKSIGIHVENGQVTSRHDPTNTRRLLDHVFGLIGTKKLSTRVGRTTPLNELIDPEFRDITAADANKAYKPINLTADEFAHLQKASVQPTTRLPVRVKSAQIELFGEKLELSSGEPSNLYRDILDLYSFFRKNQGKLSDRFPALIRMALRLECELVADCVSSEDMAAMVKMDFDQAKALLTQDQKTFLSQNAVTKDNIVTLLHTGAHNYTGSYNLQQTIAMSLIVGGILKIHCARGGH